jgi:ubiquinone/menaquinone biosynthesis C-methylase UbiE
MKLQENIVKEFNEFSKNYTADMVKVVPFYLKLLEQFSEDIPNNLNPKHILDLGCGNGNITSKLLKVFPKAYYTLLDASENMLELCQAQFGSLNKTYVQSYFQDYEYPIHRVDMVVAGFSLHHCNAKDKQQLLKNIYKSLTHNGVFICSDLMIDRKTKEHESLLEYWKDFVLNSSDNKTWNWLMEHYKTYDNPDSLNNQLKWLKEAGFTNFKVTIHNSYWVHLKAFKT